MRNLSISERRVLRELGDAATAFEQLPEQQRAEHARFEDLIAQAQNMVLARPALEFEHHQGLTDLRGV